MALKLKLVYVVVMMTHTGKRPPRIRAVRFPLHFERTDPDEKENIKSDLRRDTA